ncbi:DUF6448 family protein [Albibacterium profundi]|uniref:DUF6448 family protein n=1 Tax=Albibacterium profundi TaxID=3134906 RepID=A0ABV5CGQ3_9SPHI
MKTLNHLKKLFGKTAMLLAAFMLAFSMPIYAHCDSYDGPVIQDALKALNKGEVSYIMKWIEEEHENEIKNLFKKTVALKNEDAEVYKIVEKHFLETLVRVHREGEGAAFTGLKPAGSATPIIQMADKSIADESVNSLLTNLDKHIRTVIAEKYEKVNALSKVKDNSIEEGRAYVAAYVDYTHTLEAIEGALAGGAHRH